MRIEISKLDILFSVLLFGFGIWIISEAARYGITSETGPGSGTFPLVAGIFVTLFSAMNVVRTVHKVRREAENAQDEDEGRIALFELVKVGAIIAAIGAYLWLFPVLGPFLHLPALMVAISLVIHLRTDMFWLAVLACVSVGFTFACYLIFEVFLNILLPTGPLGF